MNFIKIFFLAFSLTPFIIVGIATILNSIQEKKYKPFEEKVYQTTLAVLNLEEKIKKYKKKSKKDLELKKGLEKEFTKLFETVESLQKEFGKNRNLLERVAIKNKLIRDYAYTDWVRTLNKMLLQIKKF